MRPSIAYIGSVVSLSRSTLTLHRAGPPTEPGASAPRARTFVGGGHILGSDEVESSYVPDPNVESAGMSYSYRRPLSKTHVL